MLESAVPRFFENRFHKFAICRNKEDPEVCAAASKRIAKLRQQWKKNRASKPTGTLKRSAYLTQPIENWDELSFHSEKVAQIFTVVMMGGITPEQCRSLITQVAPLVKRYVPPRKETC